MKVRTILIIIAILAIAYVLIPPEIYEQSDVRSEIGNGLSEILVGTNKYDLAIMASDWVLETNNSNIGARENKVDALTGLEQYEAAIEIQKNLVADKGAQTTKTDWTKLAELNAKAGNFGDSVDAYEMLVTMYDCSPTDAQSGETSDLMRSYSEKGALLIKLQRYDEAIACYNSAVDLEPSSTAAWIGLGDAYLYKSMYDQGQLKDMYKELGKKPSERDSSVNRIDISAVNSNRKAVEAYQKAVEIDPLVYPFVVTKIMGSYKKTVSGYQDILENFKTSQSNEN
ncbi:tetratricopeptide repeat protein [Methanogenium marinum]|uniref:Tetratricopeptide repeat protein n=1 Tax=Methanogenium marinum TaxID=348610 RepID=A0A9Q4PVQ4_9EURY|nr:tetratricopeptide repeat protein [Methanogenium marinum]MDE4907809.1 tetratricopeptide repeat protein [Methanogenium marinum]